jgi:hypothetical protein
MEKIIQSQGQWLSEARAKHRRCSPGSFSDWCFRDWSDALLSTIKESLHCARASHHPKNTS